MADSLNDQANISGNENVVGNENIIQIVKAEQGSIVQHVTQTVYTHSQAEKLHLFLKQAVAAYEARMYQLVAHPIVPSDQPYKFLYAFEIEDSDIFFGRESAVEKLYQTIVNDRLTILHAKSGVGKTSVLKAGFSPHLIREGSLPVYARAYDNPELAIKRAIASPALGQWPQLLSEISLHEFLGLTCQLLNRRVQELIIILDQFEEFFIFYPEKDHRQSFINVFADCYEDATLPIRFLIALRKDYYSDLADFQQRIPTILQNEYRLNTISLAEARLAITEPVMKRGRHVIYEQELVEKLLNDLSLLGGVELPHLQVVCTRLYEAMSSEETAITVAAYENFNGTEGIMRSYLTNILERLPARQEEIAKEILMELVSSEETSRVLSEGILLAQINSEESQLKHVLTHLVMSRLLRRDEIADEIVYELAHGYLIAEIKTWLDQSELEFKRAEELLRREIINWRLHQILIPKDRLELIHTYLERFKVWDEETSECILLSALQTNFEIEDWTLVIGEFGEKIFLSSLESTEPKICQAAIRGLGTLWDWPEILQLGSENAEIRSQAAELLSASTDYRVIHPLVATLNDPDDNVCRITVKSLGKIGDQNAIAPLLTILQNKKKSIGIQQVAVEALGKFDDSRVIKPLIIALKNDYANLGRVVMEALVELGEQSIVPTIAEILQDPESRDEILKIAVETLARIGIPAITPLIPVLQTQQAHIAASILGKIGDRGPVIPLLSALQSQDSVVRQFVAEALGLIGDPQAIEPLISLLQDDVIDVRRMAVEALSKFHDGRIIEPFIATLQNESSEIRLIALRSLGTYDNIQIIEPLLEALRDKNNSIRRIAAKLIVKYGDSRIIESLTRALQDEDSNVRLNAAVSLRKLGNSIGIERFLAMLENTDSNVRIEAITALGKLGDNRSVKFLVKRLKISNRNECVATIEALAMIRNPKAIKPISACLKDNFPIFGKSTEVRVSAANALGKIGDERAIQPLVGALEDKSNERNVRIAAAKALAVIGGQKAQNALESFLREARKESLGFFGSFAGAINEALKEINTPTSQAVLKNDNRCFISTACVEIKKMPDNAPELMVLRKFRDEYVRCLPEGERLIAEYYEIAPKIISKIDTLYDSKQVYKSLYVRLVLPCLKLINLGKKQEAVVLYLSIVNELKRKYLA